MHFLSPRSSLLLHLGPLPGSPYPGPRAGVAVRCLGPSSAVLSPLGLRCPCTSTNVIQLASLCLELPCGGYKQVFDSVPAHSGREGAALLAGDGEWEVSPSAPPLSSPFLEQKGLAGSTPNPQEELEERRGGRAARRNIFIVIVVLQLMRLDMLASYHVCSVYWPLPLMGLRKVTSHHHQYQPKTRNSHTHEGEGEMGVRCRLA